MQILSVIQRVLPFYILPSAISKKEEKNVYKDKKGAAPVHEIIHLHLHLYSYVFIYIYIYIHIYI